MADANRFISPIILDIQDYPKQTFYSAEQVLKFGQKELEIWQDFQEKTNQNMIFKIPNAIDESLNHAALIQNQAQNYIDNPDQDYRHQVYENINNILNQYHEDPIYITSRSLKGKIALELAKERPAAAGVLAAIITGRVIHPNSVRDILKFSEEFFHAKQALEKPKKYSAAYKSLIAEIKDEWGKLEEFAHGDLKAKIDEANELIATVDKQTTAYNRHHERLFSFFRQQYDSAKESLNTLEKTYHKKLQLDAPATYWRKRNRWHKATAAVAATVFLVSILVSLWYVEKNAQEWLDILPKGTDGNIALGSIVVLTLPAAAIAWALRIFTRLFSHNLSMASDAAQRETMVTTYLALVNDPKSNLGADERILILNALFRPSELQGSHDAPPPHLLELAKSAVTREGR